MKAITVTTFMWGELGRIEAANVDQLAMRLYIRCPFWTLDTCQRMAAALARGLVLTVQDAEAVLLPGRIEVQEAAVSYVESWRPAGVAS